MKRETDKVETLTATQVNSRLKNSKVTGEEEKALRMRLGSSVDLNAPLPKAAGQNSELADELLVVEMQLLKAMRHRQALSRKSNGITAQPSTEIKNVTKEKIVRSLRRVG